MCCPSMGAKLPTMPTSEKNVICYIVDLKIGDNVAAIFNLLLLS